MFFKEVVKIVKGQSWFFYQKTQAFKSLEKKCQGQHEFCATYKINRHILIS